MVTILGLILWIYILNVLTRSKLYFFRFIVGTVGLFYFLMIIIEPLIYDNLVNIISVFIKYIGDLIGSFETYPEQSSILINNKTNTFSIFIDYEASGIIENFVLISIITFYHFYNFLEKIIYSVIGITIIISANILRLLIVCFSIYFGGENFIMLSNIVFGRVFFYTIYVILFYYLFTLTHIKRQKVGNFIYESNDIKIN